MRKQVLYKYRSLANWAPIVDIAANSRLYAAPFSSLNDPMEGRYFYFSEQVTASLRKAIHQSKMRRNICSLSATHTSTLLWSYYAAGHCGIAFGVEVSPDVSQELRQVRYDSGVYIGDNEARRNADELALNILTQKQLPWAHEQEFRVFSPTNYVPVKLRELILGCNIDQRDEELVVKLVRKWHPRIRVTRLERSSLDKPEAVGI